MPRSDACRAPPALALCAAALVFGAGCRAHRATADEIVTQLKGAGLEVQRHDGADTQLDWPGFETNVHLTLDSYEDYNADRFASADVARGYCGSLKFGARIGLWCVHPVSGSPALATWQKVATLGAR